ncbi:Actin-related protein 10-like [Homarus americanus]|uniref:Actin-related protein 10-like n=1 Tax=Homarus americanus TaxID=6706 RepID=A0A8J5K5F2_HOMAM|nr:Actin-related protein 10-like [Homarus americanus]
MPLYEGLGGIGLINEKNITVIIDFGSSYTKAGFAGETGPRVITKSEVKCRETGKIVPVFEAKDDEELRHHLVDFIHKLYFRNLLVNPKDRRVVVVENLLGPSSVRNAIAKVLSLLFVPSHLVSLMTLGMNTGLVVDLGYNETTVVPIYESVPILSAWQALPLGGKAIHSSLCELLLDRALTVGEDGKEQRLSAVVEQLSDKVLEDIKARTCFVTSLDRSGRLQNNKYDRAVEPPPPPPSVQYPMSGSRILTLPGSVREMVTEILFERDEDMLSVPSMILNSLMKCPIDTRRALAENLVLIGGTASLKGMKHRILSEVRALVTSPPFSDVLQINSFKVHHPPAKDNYVAWLGGAILGGTEAVVLRSLPRDQYIINDTVPDWCNLAFNTKDEHDEKSA